MNSKIGNFDRNNKQIRYLSLLLFRIHFRSFIASQHLYRTCISCGNERSAYRTTFIVSSNNVPSSLQTKRFAEKKNHREEQRPFKVHIPIEYLFY